MSTKIDRPIFLVEVLSGPQVFLHPSSGSREVEIHFVCRIKEIIDRADKDEDWDNPFEGNLTTFSCSSLNGEIPQIGDELQVIYYDNYYLVPQIPIANPRSHVQRLVYSQTLI